MSKFTEKIVVGAMKLGMKIIGADVSQDEALEALGEVTITDGMPEILREAAAETAILLKNDNTLPFAKGSRVSVFGRVQNDWFFTGYGSGGDVKKPYGVNLIDGLKNCEDLSLNTELSDLYETWCGANPVDHGVWGHWPRFYDEMPLTAEIVKNAKENSDHAVYVIGRSSGEDRENALEKGSFYVTDEERNALHRICEQFDKVTLLLNIGSVIDMSWIREFDGKIGAILIVWQGGMESGNAVADLLCGKVTPSGKLTDTIATKYEDYPSSAHFGNLKFNEYVEDIYVGYRWFETFAKDKVLYPFGYGLSYTTFDITTEKFDCSNGELTFTCTVKNTGDYKGKETVQIYVEKPCGTLGNPARELIGFAKTKELAPDESETLVITVPENRIWSYDDNGKSGYAHAYVMEKGEYNFHVGNSVRDAQQVCSFSIQNTELKEQLSQAGAPQVAFERYVAVEENGVRKATKETVKLREYDLKQIILDNIKDAIPQTGDKGIKLQDVKDGKATLDEFVAQLSLDELEAISRGDYKMDSPRRERIMSTKILIVDDDKRINELLNDIFTMEGFDVVCAYDGEGAINILDNDDTVQVVVLDIMLPKIDGWELLDYIKANFDVKVLMLTALGDEEDEVRGIRNGADDYVTKPFKRAVLLERVRRLAADYEERIKCDLVYEDLTVNQRECRVFIKNNEIKLTVIS